MQLHFLRLLLQPCCDLRQQQQLHIIVRQNMKIRWEAAGSKAGRSSIAARNWSQCGAQARSRPRARRRQHPVRRAHEHRIIEGRRNRASALLSAGWLKPTRLAARVTLRSSINPQDQEQIQIYRLQIHIC